MTKPNGGPAFPVECSYNGAGKIVGLQTSPAGGWETGMSLRDWFAGQMLANGTVGGAAASIAEWAYEVADAMLAERAK